jgi:hypothetical protein
LAVHLGIFHSEIMVVESCTPALKSYRFGLVEIHESSPLGAYWFYVQYFQFPPLKLGDADEAFVKA